MEGDQTRRGKEALSGGHLCHVCGYQYPNPNPSARLRRSHRRNCRKETAAAAGEDGGGGALGVHEREEAAGERSAGEGLVLGGGGGDRDGGNGATEANGGSVSGGSAEGDGDSVGGKENADHASPSGAGTQVFTSGCVETGLNECRNSSVETANEGNGVDLPRACANGSQHEVVKHCSEIAPLAVAHPAEREDSFDEYQDASPFLHQSDPEDCAAVAHKSDIPTENQNLTNVSLGTNGAANEVSVERNGLCKDHFSRESSTAGFSAGSNVGKEVECYSENGTVLAGPEDSLKLDSTDECSVNIDSNNAEHSSHDFNVQDTSDVQLPVENSCLVNSLCSVPGYQNDLAVANADDMLKSIADDNSSEDILVKGSELDSSCEEKPQDVEQIVTIVEEDPCLENCSGFSKEGVCNDENDCDVPTKYQVSTSQEHVTLLMDQASCFKNPFNLDDTRSDDLFELASGSYHLEASNVVESKQQVDSTSLTASNQTSIAEGQHSLISDDRMIDVSSENGNAVSAEVVLVSSSADHTKNISLHDASVNHSMQEGESHASGITFVPAQGTMPISQEINARSAYAEEMIETEDTGTKDLTVVESIDNFEEKKQIEDTTAKELNADNVEEKLTENAGAGVNVDNAKEEKLTENAGAGVNVDNAKEEKLTENAGAGVNVDNAKEEKLTEHTGAGMNAVQHADGVEEKEQTEYTGAKVVGAEKNIENIHEKNQTEDTCAKKTCTELNADNGEDKMQADDTSEEAMNAMQQSDNLDETNQAQETNATKMNAIQGTYNAEEKEAESTADLQGNKPNQEIAAIGAGLTSGRIHAPLKVLLAEASAENKEKKPSTKERVLSFRRRVSKDDAKPGSPKSASDDLYWNSPAKLPRNNVDKRSKARKQPWMPFICCHSVH